MPLSHTPRRPSMASRGEQPKERLLEMLGQLVVRWPAILGILNVAGFERDADEENDDLIDV